MTAARCDDWGIMWRCVVFFNLAWLANGQLLLTPGSKRAVEMAKYFDADLNAVEKESGKLTCAIRPYPARLSFNFQFWTGYDVVVPAIQFAKHGRERPMVIALQVTPRGGGKERSFMYQRAGLPRRIPVNFWETKGVEFTLGGGFVVGPGKYDVTLLLTDSAGRVCHKNWSVEGKKIDIPTQFAPGTVAESGLESWKGIAGGSGKLSVYVHAAPIMRRRVMTKLSPWDRNLLLSSLTSLLDVGGYGQARVTVFDFDGRRVLFASENFGAADYDRLVDVLRDLSFGTVSLKTLQGANEIAFLEGLMRKEVEQKDAGDAVVFLGPSWRWGDKISPLLREQRAQLASVFYVALTPWVVDTTDLLQKFVKAGPKGRVLAVAQPQDLAKAVREIRDKRSVIQ